jgi:hypothetical protein
VVEEVEEEVLNVSISFVWLLTGLFGILRGLGLAGLGDGIFKDGWTGVGQVGIGIILSIVHVTEHRTQQDTLRGDAGGRSATVNVRSLYIRSTIICITGGTMGLC